MVNDNVRLIRPLGKGAMGDVWVAQHLTLRTEVAVKFITKELGNHHHEVNSRFEQEASMAAQIKSPYVVQTFDQGKMADGTPFIVMELLEGESLQALLDRVGPLQPALVVKVVAQMAKGMSKAHKLGIVHRDIKPDNVFIST
ncbi:MAG TPA: serine/threonine protein kinase, partial [Sorangium sp.]|nr:serine/threonine protein kinase [Sorangium sp.]